MALYDADGSNKQKPSTTAKGYKQLAGYSILPAENTLEKTPTYIIVNEPGVYAFSYPDHTTGQTTSSYITGSKVGLDGDVYSPLKLDINPVKWKKVGAGETAAVGDVIFVYRRIG
jgi:hypothetical protein